MPQITTDRWITRTEKQRKMKEDIDEFCKKYGPKLIETKIEDGLEIKVYEAR